MKEIQLFNKVKKYYSEKGKRTLFDFGFALVIPAIFAFGYYFFSADDDTSLLSLVVQDGGGQEYGTKAKEALSALRSITMDASIFEDPVFTSLEEFSVEIDESVTLGRTYPFTPPSALRNLDSQ